MSRRRLGQIVAAFGLAASVLVTACGSTSHASAPTTSPPPSSSTTTKPAADTTSVEHFAPWSTSGAIASGLKVIGSTTGKCTADSVAVPTSGVYRCTAGSVVYDPCFSTHGTGAQLACAAAPWSGVERFDATSLPAANGAPGSTRRPWAIELSNGARCVVNTGTTPALGPLSLPYECGPSGALASTVAEGSQPWTVQYDAHGSAGGVSKVDVVTAWD